MAADRKHLIKTIHAAARSLGMDEDTRREMMRMAVDKSSCADMSVRELERVVAALREKSGGAGMPRRSRPQCGEGGNPLLPKIRALWLSLHHLGVVRDASDTALDKFQRGVTGVDAMRWLTPRQANKVIEALKDWAARPVDKGGAGVEWGAHDEPRRCVVAAQWRRLVDLGAIDHPDHVDAERYGYPVTGKAAFLFYGPADYDRLIRALGTMLRKELGRRGGSQTLPEKGGSP